MIPRPANRRSERGTSFAELMVASLVIGTTVVASTSSMSESAQVYHFFSDGPHEALMLAQEIHEAALLLPWEPDAGAEGFGPDVDTLWDLHELALHPPRSAEFEKVKSHVTWRQEVEVRHVDMENPTVAVDPDTFEGDTLIELRVHVEELDGLYIGNDESGPTPGIVTDFGWFSWWMSEPTVEEDA